jgi:hypothetical protein
MGSDLLEKSEKSIREACHQKLEAACLIGEELGKIEKEELFRARGYASFETYLQGIRLTNCMGATADYQPIVRIICGHPKRWSESTPLICSLF